jgi:AbrB family looped-hinge helix DNA binding protein
MDQGGRVVIPKALRERLQLRPGNPLEILERDGHIEVSPAPTSMTLVRSDGVPVALPEGELPLLTEEVVRSTLEQVRR